MRLLYVYRYGILGGVTTQLASRLSFLSSAAEPHFAFLEDHGGRSAFGGYPHTYITPSSQELAQVVRGGRFDMVLVIDTPEAYKALAAAGFRGHVVNEVHTTTANLEYLAKLRGQRIHAFLAPSAYLARRIEDEFGFAGEVPCHVTGNCLDTDLFHPITPPIAPRDKVLLWVGKLDEHKNWRGFLSVAAILSDRRQDFELLLLGGETAPDEVAGEMLDVAETYGVLLRLRWIQRVDYHTMPRIYGLTAASGGLCLSTSRNESFGMTVAEALACGCPAAGAEVGAIPEILDGDLAANLYPFFDAEAAAAVVERILGQPPEERALCAERGREKVVRRYSQAAVGERYLDLLRTIRGLPA